VEEYSPCRYRVSICVPSLCAGLTETSKHRGAERTGVRMMSSSSSSDSPSRKTQLPPTEGGGADDQDNEEGQEEENQGIMEHVSRPYFEHRIYDETVQNKNLDGIVVDHDNNDHLNQQQQQVTSDDKMRQNKKGSTEARAGYLMDEELKLKNKEVVKSMFIHAYDGYMYHAFPHGELKPLSCSGKEFDLIKIPAVTLIDTLDTLVILNNFSEFKRAVKLVSVALPNKFDFDVSVSVFESNIRLLGGLISAHQFAMDEDLGIYKHRTSKKYGSDSSNKGSSISSSSSSSYINNLNMNSQDNRVAQEDYYDGSLLELAIDLGDRLMPAFETPTSIPYGTVNLRYGVPKGETVISSLAGAGSLTLEFTMLSQLTKNEKYAKASQAAVNSLLSKRTHLGLLGKHVNIRSGKWSESISGIGSNADSFYEYLLKMYMLFGEEDWWYTFLET
jgi:hypothetical protein